MSKTNGGRRYAKIDEAAEYLNVHPQTIRVMLADGRLTPYQMGRQQPRRELDFVVTR